MKAMLFACFGTVLFGCGEGYVGSGDVDIATSKMTLSEALTTVTILDDCDGGGTMQAAYTVDDDVPGQLLVNATFTYTACVTKKDGTVAGTVTYSNSIQDTAGTETVQVAYVSNLTYSDGHTGACLADVTFNDVAAKPNKTSVAKLCPHPWDKLLSKLEKCKLGKECKLKL